MERARARAFVTRVACAASLAAALAASVVACAPSRGPAAPAERADGGGRHVTVATQIVTPVRTANARELTEASERALAESRFDEAARGFDLVLAADPDGDYAARATYGVGAARDGLGDRPGAAAAFEALGTRFPDDPHARSSWLRAVELYAYLERWDRLGAASSALLARQDLARIDQLLGISGRALASVEQGEEDRAARDIRAGTDIVEEYRLGEGGRTPVAVAQLRFALAELRRLRSERIVFGPVGDDFGGRLEARCQGLLDAQSAYTDAMHAVDPHWAAMAGVRVGEMYRKLHADVMAVPTPTRVQSEKDGQIFFAAMHLRYRVLLEKGLKMMAATVELAERTGDASVWKARAEAGKRDIEVALAAENATIAKFPFTEAEMKRALELLLARAERERSAGSAPARTPRSSAQKP